MGRPLSYVMAFAWTFGATLLLLVGVQFSVAMRPSSATDIVQLGAWEALVYVLACFGVLRVHAPEKNARDALGLRIAPPAMTAFGLALGVALHLPAESLRQLVERLAPTPESDLIQRAAMLSADTSTRALSIVLVATCIIPLVEELFFRGALYTCLRRAHPVVGAAAITAVCFVLSHPDTRTWLPFAVVSAVLTQLRAASGSMLPCLALHVGFNAVTIAVVLTGVSSVASPIRLGWPVVLAGWLVSVALVFAVQYLARRSPDAERARAEDADEL